MSITREEIERGENPRTLQSVLVSVIEALEEVAARVAALEARHGK